MDDDSSQHNENSNEYNESATQSDSEDGNSKDNLIKQENSSSPPPRTGDISKNNNGDALSENETSTREERTDEDSHQDENQLESIKNENDRNCSDHEDESDKFKLCDTTNEEVDKIADVDQLEEPRSDDSDAGRRKKRKRRRCRRRLPAEDTLTNEECNKDSEDTIADINKEQTNSRLTDHEDNDQQSQDTPKIKRALRKTTTLKDSLTVREGDAFLNEGDMDDEPELPPKRRRKRARPRSASYETEAVRPQPSDLELGYKILEQIMVFPSATPFLDQPDEKGYKMENYYEFIKSPIWLKEIERKYHDKEYTIVSELIRDIRRVFENCYNFWGAVDPLSKKALRVEEFLEKKISLLQPSVKQQCSLDVTHGEEPGEVEEENETGKEEQPTSETKRYCQMINKFVNPKGKYNSGNFVSKLLRRVISRKTDSEIPSRRVEEVEKISKEVEDWEKSILLIDDVVNEISAMWELPAIGHFFYLTLNVLNIEPISQLELERMLLVPQASIMLAKVMTTMLIPPLSRAKLEVGPPMPYCIWTAKLRTKVSSWYRIYRQARGQTLKVFEQIGIEPDFWSVLDKKKNPLEHSEFHELSFFQKVWLLKSLCDYLLHNHKTIQDVINNIEPEELREKCLGKDRLGYTYHYFPEFSEVRIYKQAKVTESKWYGFEAGVEEVIKGADEEVKNKSEPTENKLLSEAAGIKKFLHKLPRNIVPSAENFKLVASSVEDIRCLIDEFCSADSQVVQGRGPTAPLVMRLNAIINELEPIESTLINSVTYIRKKMHKEWTDYKNRDPDNVDPGISYWERREKDHPEKEEKPLPAPTEEASGENSIAEQPEPSERRERRSKRESQIRYMNMDFDGLPEDDDPGEEYFEEDEDSEDEWTASPSKKKKKAASNKRMKKMSDQIKLQPDGILNRRNSNSNFFPFGEVRIKQENIKMEKIEGESKFDYMQSNKYGMDLGIHIKQEPDTSYPLPKQPLVKQELHVPSQTVVRTLVKFSTPVQQQCNKVPIKRSNSPESEIVEISDEDPDSPPDVKPVLDDLRSIKTVDCVVPLVDQRVGSRPPYNQNQFLGQYPNNNINVPFTPSRDNPVYVNNISNVTPFVSQVRGSLQQAVPTVRSPHNPNIVYSQSNMNPPSLKQSPQPSPHNQNVAYSQNNMSSPSLKQSPQSFVNKSKNVLQTNSSPQGRNSQNYFANPLNSKNSSPVNRPFVNSSSPQLLNRSPVPRQNFLRSPTIQRSPRGPLQNMPSPRGPIMPSPGRGRPRTLPNIRMPSPSQRDGLVRQVSPQQINNKVLGNSPQLRQRSPSLISQRNITPPQQRMPGTSFTSPTNRFQNIRAPNQPLTPQARRNLNFNSPTRPASQDPPLQIVNTGNVIGKNVKTVEGKLTVALTDDGSYGYHVVLSDGGRVTLTTSQLSELRAKNGGSLPQKVGVPMVQSSD